MKLSGVNSRDRKEGGRLDSCSLRSGKVLRQQKMMSSPLNSCGKKRFLRPRSRSFIPRVGNF